MDEFNNAVYYYDHGTGHTSWDPPVEFAQEDIARAMQRLVGKLKMGILLDANTHTYTHMHTYTYTHAHTYVCSLWCRIVVLDECLTPFAAEPSE